MERRDCRGHLWHYSDGLRLRRYVKLKLGTLLLPSHCSLSAPVPTPTLSLKLMMRFLPLGMVLSFLISLINQVKMFDKMFDFISNVLTCLFSHLFGWLDLSEIIIIIVCVVFAL